MKEFDNWWKYYCGQLHKKGLECFGLQPDHSAKVAWRAALRYAKAMHSVSSEVRFDLNITEELNEN